MPRIRERPADCDPPDPAYLDAFLQGARFALFALEGRLRDETSTVPDELDHALDEFHDLYASTRDGLDSREARVAAMARFLGKN